jgi:hypothetical protein
MLLHWAVDELPLILDGTLKLLLLCRTSHSPHGKFYPLVGGKEVGYILAINYLCDIQLGPEVASIDSTKLEIFKSHSGFECSDFWPKEVLNLTF